MSPRTDTRTEGPPHSHRRRFLQGVGATGIAGVLAGCLGGDDGDGSGEENGDENGDENGTENGDDGTGNGTDPAYFAVGDVDPAEIAVARGEDVDVSATIENTGGEEGVQEVVLSVDGEETDSVELTLGGGESETVDLGFDTADLEVGDYEYAVSTDDEAESASLSVEEVIGDDPDPLVSLADDTFGVGTGTLTATLDNPYPVELEDGEVELEAPDGWELEPESGTSFDVLDPDGSQEATWELTVPEGAEGDYELTAHVSYASASEEADVTTGLPITVDVWHGVEFVDVLHFEDVYDGIEDRAHQNEEGETIQGQIEWHEYEVDLSPFLPATDVQLRFEDAYPEDGWGPSVAETIVYADGEEIHAIEATTEEEAEYLVEDGDSNDEAFEWRFADGNTYWVYGFDVPEDAETLTVRFQMQNGFYVTGRAIPESQDVEIDPVASVPYGFNAGGEPDDPASDVPVEVDGLEFVDAPNPHVGYVPHARVTHGEVPDEFDWFEPPAGVSDDSDAVDSIADTDHDALYQTEFHGPDLGFEIFVENGTYDVTLHFAETNPNLEAGDRVFDVAVQGETVVEGLDVANEVGHDTAYAITVEEVEVEFGRLVIDSTSHEDLTKYCAVEVRWGGDPLERDLVAHFPLDDDEPTDAVGGGDGTIEGDGVETNADGVVDGAYEFTDGYVDLGEFGIDGGSASISLWFNAESWQDERTQIAYWGDDPPNLEMSVNGGDLDPFYWDGDDVRGPGTVGVPMPTEEWVHYVVTYDDGTGTWTTYVDGDQVEEATVEDAVDVSFDGAMSRLGSHPSQARQFEGRLDDVRFYSRALSAADVGALYDLADE